MFLMSLICAYFMADRITTPHLHRELTDCVVRAYEGMGKLTL